jgi:hypothetical protein
MPNRATSSTSRSTSTTAKVNGAIASSANPPPRPTGGNCSRRKYRPQPTTKAPPPNTALSAGSRTICTASSRAARAPVRGPGRLVNHTGSGKSPPTASHSNTRSSPISASDTCGGASSGTHTTGAISGTRRGGGTGANSGPSPNSGAARSAGAASGSLTSANCPRRDRGPPRTVFRSKAAARPRPPG